MDTQEHTTQTGGAFLVGATQFSDIFIPEDFGEDADMVRTMVRDFVEQEIVPRQEAIEKQEAGVVEALLRKAAELGLLGAHMPEEYGGMEMDENLNTLISDGLGPAGSFTVAFGAHTGIGMLPILFFGTSEQKSHYLPRLINGELKASYCLTEPGSGSDALAARTRADLSDDSTYYILNGQKMWITNAGFANFFIVFAQVGGDKFTGFIVDGDSDGLTLGAEEDKMGIKGSSTRQVFLENVKVPTDRVLGQIGKGHHIAFNALNIGRYKLGVMCLGGCKMSATTAVRYANERIQFKVPISSFGAIKYKLAEQAIRIFALDTAIYRVSGLLEAKNKALIESGSSYAEAKLSSAEEYAIECSIIKIAGSEILDYVVDETLQIHGGMGFSEEGTSARAYRDARINRIYEGTNEINRLLMVDQLFKRALKGRIDLIGPAWDVQKELTSMPSMEKPSGTYGQEEKAIEEFRKALLMVAGGAAKMQMDGKLNLEEEQEIVMNVADMMTDLFLAESLLMRVQRLHSLKDKPADQSIYDAILRVFLTDMTARVTKTGTDALISFAEGDLLRTFLMGLKRFTKYPPTNIKTDRRLIADALISQKSYIL
ncbi:MAG: acyl-CoA dehydrogenase family protein [Saprospiraceae bacterium]